MAPAFWAAGLAVLAAAAPAMADEAPKYGGILTYMIPADSPPSFDAQREETYATIHSAAPFYSVLIRINPNDPESTTDIVCDLCTEMPQPTDGGKTYTFKIRDDVKFHNGDGLTAEDVAASLNKIAFPPDGVVSPRSATFMMVDKIAATDSYTVVIHLKFATSAFLPALADPYNWIYQKKILDLAGFWPDIEKSRAEARRLLKEAGAEGLSFELVNRDVDQPYKYLGIWLIDQWSKIGLHVTQNVVPTGPWFAALRGGDFSVSTGGSCHGIVNPVMDVQPWLPRSVSESNYGYYEDPKELDIYEKMLHETNLAKQRALMLQYNERVLDEEAHYIHSFWWNRLVPLRSYVHGWKIGPSHYSNQDLGTIWLSAPECGTCSAHPTMEHAQVETGK